MPFRRCKQIEPDNRDKMREMLKEIHEKTGKPFAETYVPPAENDGDDYPEQDINPDDVPF
jgi:hypothetical protein